ncbi:hypothetical protein [Thomasclavelia sp.]|uniref:hypothetical protein n=1 Tax=Thomasclavelia sp. TaxID=3025757 RepID=UPI0025DE23DE|nr:hypothetical protein [Thomasclavelia sp.]
MKNVFKCSNSKEINYLSGIPTFKIEINQEGIILSPNKQKRMKKREFLYLDIDKIELSYIAGQYSTAIAINKTVSYYYDLNIYLNGQKYILEFSKLAELKNCIDMLEKFEIVVDDPIGIYDILNTKSEYEVEKYLIRNSKQLKEKLKNDDTRTFESYITE